MGLSNAIGVTALIIEVVEKLYSSKKSIYLSGRMRTTYEKNDRSIQCSVRSDAALNTPKIQFALSMITKVQ